VIDLLLFPAQRCQSLRTSHPIESTFGSIRHRSKPSNGIEIIKSEQIAA